MVSSMIKQESFDSSLNNSSLEVLKSQNSQVPVVSSNAYATNAAAVKNSNVNHSPKIGSRRIFTPHFKLQVLESYRSDSDCKGNQRATARKYNIHRRQIQKWLQCETNLRSSVANINQTNVKHQFHNITQLQQQQQQLQMPINTTDSQFNRRHIQHLLHKTDSECLQRSMDTSRQCVLPGSLMETASSASLLSAQAVKATKNLTTGAMSAANKTKKNMALAMSPLRSTASASSDAIVAPSMHPLHHHHYPITYAHLSDSALVSVPITNYMPSHHHLHHHPYQNQFHHSHSLIPQLPSSYQPTASLSETMLSAPRSEASEIAKVQNKVVAKWKNEVQHEESRYINRVCTLIENENHDNYLCRNNPNETIGCREGKYNNDWKCKIAQQNVSAAPMDLSLGPRREQPVEVNSSNHKDLGFTSYNGAHSRPIEKDDIVDLTFRKRKYFSNGVSDVPAEKVIKRVDDGVAAAVDESLKIESVERQDNNEDNTEEIEIDVEERTAPSKPIKLFKPYLLDEEDAENEAASCTSTAENNVQRDPIIWSHHPACASPNNDIACQNFRRGSAFQSPSHEMFPTTNSCFHVVESGSRSCNYNTSSPPSSLELTLGGLQCPKGSPVSGYESSSSTYSDSSSGAESRENNCNRAELQLDLKLHPIFSEDMILNKSHIQKWLDQGPNKPTPNASIALYI